MALARNSRNSLLPQAPKTRLALTFRELVIDGKKDWRHCWTFAQFVADEGDDEMVRVMECYRKLKKREQLTASPEFVCELAGVSPNDFAAEIFRAYLAYSGDAANLIEAASRPDVVAKQIKVALTTDGWRDRKMLHEHSGFLPPKTGGGIHVNASANAENKSATVIQAPELEGMEANTLRFTRVLKAENTQVIEAPAEAPRGVPALGGEQ